LGDAVDIVIVVRVSAVDERQDDNREPRPRWLPPSRQDWRLAFRELSVCRRARDRRRLGCLRRVSPALPQPMRQTVARGGEVAAIGLRRRETAGPPPPPASAPAGNMSVR